MANNDITPADDQADAYAIDKAARAIKDTTEQQPYIQQAQADLSKWMPHDWVIAAINAAYRDGMQAQEAEHEYLIQQMQEQHQQDETGMVRATVAAIMEALTKGFVSYGLNDFIPYGQPIDTMSVTLDMEAQRTIWDRFGLQCVLSDDKKTVTWTLTSNKALPKAE